MEKGSFLKRIDWVNVAVWFGAVPLISIGFWLTVYHVACT